MRSLYILIVINLLTAITVSAQRSDRDSIWIQNIISNGGEYRLNNETWDAIRNGTFLNTEPFIIKPALAPAEYPITKEFDDIRVPDGMFRDIGIVHLPNSETLLIQYTPEEVWIVNSALLKDQGSILVTGYYRIPHTSIEIVNPTLDHSWTDFEFVHGSWEGYLAPRTFATFSAEDALEDAFEPTERHKRENRKNANAWKTYNMQEMDE